jgi:hypothetical protein
MIYSKKKLLDNCSNVVLKQVSNTLEMSFGEAPATARRVKLSISFVSQPTLKL